MRLQGFQGEISDYFQKKSLSHVSHLSIVPLTCPLCKTIYYINILEANSMFEATPMFRFHSKSETQFKLFQYEAFREKLYESSHMSKNCTNSHVTTNVTLLHFDHSVQPIETEQWSTCVTAKNENMNAVASHLLSKTVALNTKVLLATAHVRVYSPHKFFITVCAALDQGSVSIYFYPLLPNLLNGFDF